MKSADFTNIQKFNHHGMSPKALIESCLTFNGGEIEEDMNFLTNAF